MSEIWHLLNIDSLTNNCGFGLEYYLMGNKEKAKPLLMKGIEFCDMIEKGNLALNNMVIDQTYLEAWEDIQILMKHKSQDEFKTIVEEAASVKVDLLRMLNENITYSEYKIRNIQRFFIDAGKPYLSRAHSLLRAIEKRY